MFLGYSSCHLGYRCLDLFSDCIYISGHVRFHENSFPSIECDRVFSTTHFNLQPAPISHLPTLTYFPSYKPPQTPTLPTHTLVPLPPFASMCLDHFACLGFAAPDIIASDSFSSVVPLATPPALHFLLRSLHSHHRT